MSILVSFLGKRRSDPATGYRAVCFECTGNPVKARQTLG
jgi:hypothetical protein